MSQNEEDYEAEQAYLRRDPLNCGPNRQRKLYCLGCEERYHDTLNEAVTPHRIAERITIWVHHPLGSPYVLDRACGPLVDIGI